jgi:restriction endonuclease S subunit
MIQIPNFPLPIQITITKKTDGKTDGIQVLKELLQVLKELLQIWL